MRKSIEAVRAFNRFYTRHLGLLDAGLHGSSFSLTEVRVLYELAHHRPAATAGGIARELGLDFGYLSRLLAKFEGLGLLTRKRSASDGRQSSLHLTAQGRAAFSPLDRAAREQVAAILARLDDSGQRDLLAAMQAIHDLLEPSPSGANHGPAFTLRPFGIGDLGWITHRQGILYSQEYGWDGTYEALVAEILAQFVRRFRPDADRGWVAERNGQIVGSVFLVHSSAKVARLRLLYVEPSARGLGIGRHLVDECIAFARAKGYRTLTLWTNDVLVSARRLYEAAGFLLTAEDKHRSFGKDLTGQTWERTLGPGPTAD